MIAGSIDALYRRAAGAFVGAFVWQYRAPVMAGNTLGGVLLVAGLNHVQVEAA